jgi:hypothetical protein
MTPHSEIESQIDEALHRLGGVEPPTGMEQRVYQRLQGQRRRFTFSVVQYVSAGALAAGVALSALVLNPAVRSALLPAHPAVQGAPRVGMPATGAFGVAGKMQVLEQPVPVQPTPENQGRGRARSGRSMVPKGTPLPRGVIAPRTPIAVPAAR